MNKLINLLAAACAFVATPAMAQQVTAGADIASHGATTGRLDVSGFNLFGLGAGVEARSRFGDRRFGVDELTGRIGYRFGANRFSITPTVQLGLASFDRNERNIFATAGVGAEGRVNVLPGLDGVASYTYRTSLPDNNHRYRLNEYRAGGEYRINPEIGVNVGYFKRTGTIDSDGVAVGLKYGF
jgi:hypothetical protein